MHRVTTREPGDLPASGRSCFGPGDGRGTVLPSERRTSGGGRIGYDRQIGEWPVGGVVEWSRYDLEDAVTGWARVYTDDGMGNYGELPAAYVFTRRLRSAVALRAR